MENTELATIAKQNGLEDSKVNGLLSRFGDSFQTATKAMEWSKTVNVTNENQTDLMKQARTARLKLKDIRVKVEHTRKELKEQSLREGKAIDGMANIIKAMIVPAEEHLEKQEKFAENLAAERKARITAERLNKLSELTDTPELYSYENMSDEIFDNLINELKAAKKNQEAAAKKAEEDRIAAEKEAITEQERIRSENDKLKAEAEAKEKALAEERARVEAERKAADDLARKEREAVEAKLKAEREKLELAERAEAQRKAEEERKTAEAQEKERQALLAPDHDKLVTFANAIHAIKNTKLPAVKTKQAQDIVNQIETKLVELENFINTKAKEL